MTLFSRHITLKALIVLGITLGLTGCRSSRKATESISYAEMSAELRYTSLCERLESWEEITVPLKVELTAPQKLSAGGKAYMRRDKDIFITLRFLGFEVANVYANADSIFILDKINRKYIAEDVSSLLGGASLTIGDIQDILTGRPFIAGHGTLTADDMSQLRLVAADTTLIVKPASAIGQTTYSFSLSDATNTPEALTVETPNRQFEMQYSNPRNTPVGLMMGSDYISTQVGRYPLELTLNWNFDNIGFKVERDMKPRIPSNYKRIIAADLLKGLNM